MRWKEGVRPREEYWKRYEKRRVKGERKINICNLAHLSSQSSLFLSPPLLALYFAILNTDLNKWIFISATMPLPKAYGNFFSPPCCAHRMVIANLQLEALLVFKE